MGHIWGWGQVRKLFWDLLTYTNNFYFGSIALSCFFETFPGEWVGGWVVGVVRHCDFNENQVVSFWLWLRLTTLGLSKKKNHDLLSKLGTVGLIFKKLFWGLLSSKIPFCFDKPKVVSRSQSQKLTTWFSLKSHPHPGKFQRSKIELYFQNKSCLSM